MVEIQTYLDKSLRVLDKFGFLDRSSEESQLAQLLDNILSIDEPKIVAIAKTVRHIGDFSQIVREKVGDSSVSMRYQDISSKFDSIREDSKRLVSQLEDGKIDWKEKISNLWMRLSRGTTHERFEDIKGLYESVSQDTKKQLENEREIIDSYIDFRFALKEADILAKDVLFKQESNLSEARNRFEEVAQKVQVYAGSSASEKSRLELLRDEAKRTFDDEDRKYQLIKDVSENLSMGYNIGETLISKLRKTHDMKDQVYRRAVTFFTTNEHVFTTLDAVYTSQHGLHETTQVLEAMKQGANRGLEDIAELGDGLERAALKAGYGSTYNPSSVQKLVDSIVRYQEESSKIIGELRNESTSNAREVERIVEEGKERARVAVLHYSQNK